LIIYRKSLVYWTTQDQPWHRKSPRRKIRVGKYPDPQTRWWRLCWRINTNSPWLMPTGNLASIENVLCTSFNPILNPRHDFYFFFGLDGCSLMYTFVYDDFCFRFDLYFRKNPFGGEYTVFAGLEECVRFIANFKLTEEQIDYIRNNLSVSCEV